MNTWIFNQFSYSKREREKPEKEHGCHGNDQNGGHLGFFQCAISEVFMNRLSSSMILKLRREKDYNKE